MIGVLPYSSSSIIIFEFWAPFNQVKIIALKDKKEIEMDETSPPLLIEFQPSIIVSKQYIPC